MKTGKVIQIRTNVPRTIPKILPVKKPTEPRPVAPIRPIAIPKIPIPTKIPEAVR